ncbi:acyl carrier protein [Streptomyces pathocidini]|uniref:Acyl carrier protein n=2 Tax=Streptomyces pathocidini TaxID=1650571 RepID=A0ABW7UPB3_9ACTN
MAEHETLAPLILADLLKIMNEFLLGEEEEVDPHDDLLELGFDSISLAALLGKMNKKLGVDLEPVVMFDCPSLHELTEYLVENYGPTLQRHYEGGSR